MPKVIELNKYVFPPAFLTGSRVYGIPKEESDIDLVVFLTKETYYKLSNFCPTFNPNDHPSASDEEACPSLRFGTLNIIPVFEPELYEAWKKGTELLTEDKPVSRKRAIEVLDKIRLDAKMALRKRQESERRAIRAKNGIKEN